MNLNLAVIAGLVAVHPEQIPAYPPAPASMPGDSDPNVNMSDAPPANRLLIAVRSDVPQRRVDLVPVVVSQSLMPEDVVSGDRLWIAGALQRRFSPTTGRSRLEVVAGSVERQSIGS